MAISRVASATANGTSVSSLSINKPAGVVEGDLLIAVLVSNVATTPSLAGWTVAVNTENADVLWKRAGASEPSSYAFSLSVSVTLVGAIVAYRGASLVTAFDVNPTSATQAAGSGAKTISAVTPSLRRCMLVAYVGHETVDSYDWAAPFTEVLGAGDSRGSRVGIAEYDHPGTAAQGATYTPNGSAPGQGVKGLMALRPAFRGWIG